MIPKSGLNMQVLVVSSVDGYLNRSFDGGLTFSVVTMPVSGVTWGRPWLSDTGQYQIIGCSGLNGGYFSTDYGATWNQIPGTMWGNYTVAFVSPSGQSMQICSTINYTSRYSTDYGATWSNDSWSSYTSFIWFDNSRTNIIEYSNASPYECWYSENGGGSWSASNIPYGNVLYGWAAGFEGSDIVSYSHQSSNSIYYYKYSSNGHYGWQNTFYYNGNHGFWDHVNGHLYAFDNFSIIKGTTQLFSLYGLGCAGVDIRVSNDEKIILAMVNTGIYRSVDSGANFTLIANSIIGYSSKMAIQRIYS